MFKNSLSNAGNVGSIPGQGSNIPHAAGHLNANAATTELFARNKSNDIHTNHDTAANTQEVSYGIRQGKWLRIPVFIYCCESLGSVLDLSFLDRYLP